MRLNVYLGDEVGEEFGRLFPASTRSRVVRTLLTKAIKSIRESDDPMALAGSLMGGNVQVRVSK